MIVGTAVATGGRRLLMIFDVTVEVSMPFSAFMTTLKLRLARSKVGVYVFVVAKPIFDRAIPSDDFCH